MTTATIHAYETNPTSERCVIVQPSQRGDDTRVHLDVVRTDRDHPDGFHTELLLTADAAAALASAIYDALIVANGPAS